MRRPENTSYELYRLYVDVNSCREVKSIKNWDVRYCRKLPKKTKFIAEDEAEINCGTLHHYKLPKSSSLAFVMRRCNADVLSYDLLLAD